MSCPPLVRYQGRHRGDRCSPLAPPDLGRLARTSTGLALTGGLVLAASGSAAAHMPSPDVPDWQPGSNAGESSLLRAVVMAEGRSTRVVGPWTPSHAGHHGTHGARDAWVEAGEGAGEENQDEWAESDQSEQPDEPDESRGWDDERGWDDDAYDAEEADDAGDSWEGEKPQVSDEDDEEDDGDGEDEGDDEDDEDHEHDTAPDAVDGARQGERKATVPVAPVPSKTANPVERAPMNPHVTVAPEKRLTPRVQKPAPSVRETPKAAEQAKPSTTSKPATPPKQQKAAPKPAPQEAAPRAKTGVVGIASGLQGIPYVWGGTSTKGFDCSGFTQHVFRKAGIDLPRTAAQQQKATKKVSDPKPGDLVFFGAPAHHVGVYAGGGKMYDAPRRGKTTGLRTIWSSNVTYGRAA